MAVLKQGENYEEQDAGIAEDSGSSRFNKKSIAIIAGVALIGIVFIAIWVTSSIHKEDVENQKIEESKSKEAAELDAYWASMTSDMVSTPVVSEDKVRELRKWGYTGDEIEAAVNEGKDLDSLISEAKALREEAAKEALSKMADITSPEYQNLLNSTWLGGEELNLPSVVDNIVKNTEEHREIVDYSKCLPARGCQLFIKVQLDNGNSAFMTVSPDRWNSLSDSGNMVVNISTVTYGGVTIVTNVAEVMVE